jgi:hypothetical protein
MNYNRTALIGISLGLVLAAATACASPNSGSANGATSTVPGALALGTPTATASALPTTAPTVVLPPAGGSTEKTSAPKKTSNPAPTDTWSPASATPPPLPSLDSVSTSTPGCTSNSGMSTVTVTWTSTAATSAWLAESPIASPFDPKTVSGGVGPLPGHGSHQMPFNCANQYDYYMIGVYNSTGHTSESDQVVNPAY